MYVNKSHKSLILHYNYNKRSLVTITRPNIYFISQQTFTSPDCSWLWICNCAVVTFHSGKPCILTKISFMF